MEDEEYEMEEEDTIERGNVLDEGDVDTEEAQLEGEDKMKHDKAVEQEDATDRGEMRPRKLCEQKICKGSTLEREAPLARSQTRNVGNNSLVPSRGAS